ncbi:hypothetical protein V6B08_13650 [Ferrovibrio sp. MS7]|uniref:hypothetical protein n=1 Tax=Ferrovibrio plantarum TaxID=3119164 RepID=UPI003135ED02
MELGSLVASQGDDLAANPAFPGELQPCKRYRAASAAQIAEIACRLDPELLGRSASVCVLARDALAKPGHDDAKRGVMRGT